MFRQRGIDWPAVLDEALGHLRRLIRIDTTNPPGNEALCASYLETVLSAEGIASRIVEPVAGRAALVARLRGTGKAAPILFTAPMDVVGVEPSQWSVTVTASGPSGHASVPLDDNAVGRLARAVALIAAHREAVTLIPTTREFFHRLGDIWDDAEQGRAMRDVASDEPERVRRGADVLSRVPLLGALLRTGISPTMLNAGVRHNVIPASASPSRRSRSRRGCSTASRAECWRRRGSARGLSGPPCA